MKNLYTTLATGLLLALSSSAIAVDKTIELQVSESQVLALYGDAFGAPKSLDMATVKAGTLISLGGVGVTSNVVGGDCNVNFSTTNGYKLTHTEMTGVVLTTFHLTYGGKSFNNNRTEAVTTSCNVSPTALKLKPKALAAGATVEAGTYKDTITVTVTTAA